MKTRAILAAVLLALPCQGDELVIDQRRQWEEWTIPAGVIDLRTDGSLTMRRFGDEVDPLRDMAAFEHETRTRGTVRGGIRALSNPGDVSLMLDGDAGTWWRPDPQDGVDKAWLDIDLGRLVLLKKIRITFPDTAGARPFRRFSVFVSEGMPIWDGSDLISFNKIGTTILPNQARILEYDLSTRDPVSGGNRAVGDNLVTADSLDFMPVQYIRFVPTALNPDAALAEIEAVAVGDNIAPGTFDRGGSIRSSQKFERTAPNLFDGSVEQFWLANAAKAAEREWQVGGQYFEWDLGVSFWLKQIILYAWPPTALGQTSFQAGSGPIGHQIEVSDGTQISFGEGTQRFRGPFDYQRISLVDNQAVPRRWIFQHAFDPRKTRYIFYHHFNWGRSSGWGFKVWEAFLYAPGHPAAVELVSGMIPLGGVKSFRDIFWEADLPPGTAVEVRTKTGDQISTKTLYYDRNGAEVSAERWNSLKKVLRGPTEEIASEGPDWSSWSDPYKISGEAFKSPTPRAFIRFKVTLTTDDPEVAPTLEALGTSFDEPLFQRSVEAEIFPRESPVGIWQRFTYRILPPPFRAGDRGFDRLLVPLAAQVRDVTAAVGGAPLEGLAVTQDGDTLRLDLPDRVLRDSVEVSFGARLLQNPTLIEALLAASDRPGVRQRVIPARRTGPDALAVFLPDLAASGAIISKLSVGSGAVTPNGDGVNDKLALSFDLLKVDAVPQIDFFNLQGRLVSRLEGRPGQQQQYQWAATGLDGSTLPPGIYLCRIRIGTDAGDRTATAVVHVAY